MYVFLQRHSIVLETHVNNFSETLLDNRFCNVTLRTDVVISAIICHICDVFHCNFNSRNLRATNACARLRLSFIRALSTCNANCTNQRGKKKKTKQTFTLCAPVKPDENRLHKEIPLPHSSGFICLFSYSSLLFSLFSSPDLSVTHSLIYPYSCYEHSFPAFVFLFSSYDNRTSS